MDKTNTENWELKLRFYPYCTEIGIGPDHLVIMLFFPYATFKKNIVYARSNIQETTEKA